MSSRVRTIVQTQQAPAQLRWNCMRWEDGHPPWEVHAVEIIYGRRLDGTLTVTEQLVAVFGGLELAKAQSIQQQLNAR